MLIIDAHMHLWNKIDGVVNGRPVTALEGGRVDFGGEIRQMTPPFMCANENTVETFIRNMDFAQVSAAVVTQEYIDGNQNEYLIAAKAMYPDRLKICELYIEGKTPLYNGFDGLKIPAGRLKDPDLTTIMPIYRELEKRKMFLSIDLADGALQTGFMSEIINECPNLRIIIGHFGMVTRTGWEAQIKLARNKNVYIESGGITWLFYYEFYPYPSAVQAIKKAADICGFEKLMWGSDYPRTMAAITYGMSYDFVLRSQELSQNEKEAFLGKTAETVYCFENLTIPGKVKSMVE